MFFLVDHAVLLNNICFVIYVKLGLILLIFVGFFHFGLSAIVGS